MYGVQEQELLDDEEQEDDHRPAGVLEVLQYLPQAHGPQRDEVSYSRERGTASPEQGTTSPRVHSPPGCDRGSKLNG